jgi:hypothetical protein
LPVSSATLVFGFTVATVEERILPPRQRQVQEVAVFALDASSEGDNHVCGCVPLKPEPSMGMTSGKLRPEAGSIAVQVRAWRKFKIRQENVGRRFY